MGLKQVVHWIRGWEVRRSAHGEMINSDFEIYSASVIIGAYPDRNEALARTRKYNQELNEFFIQHGLWRDCSRWTRFTDWPSFTFRRSDLTPIGFILVQQCHDRWLSKIDRTGKIDMSIWAKALFKAGASV